LKEASLVKKEAKLKRIATTLIDGLYFLMGAGQ